MTNKNKRIRTPKQIKADSSEIKQVMSIRIEPNLKSRIEETASKVGLSVSALISEVMKDYLKISK